MTRLAALLASLLLLATPALAQRTPAYQDGRIAPNDVIKGTTQGRYSTAGPLQGDANGNGVNPFTADDNGGRGVCTKDANGLDPAGYHQFCIGHDANGNAGLTADAYNGALNAGLVADVNGVRIPWPGSIVGLPGAVDNNALTLLPSTFSTAVVRIENTIGIGGPQVLFQSSGNACTLNSGAGDGGIEVAAADGGCWKALIDARGPDGRIWGQYGTSDDTARLQLADAAACSAAWPAGVAKRVRLPAGDTAVGNITLRCISIEGAGSDYSRIVPAPDLSPNRGWLVRMMTSGQSVEGVSFVCATYADIPGTFAAPPGCPHWQLLVQHDVVGTRINGFRVRDVVFFGGDTQFTSYGIENLDYEAENMWPYEFGAIWSDVKNSNTAATTSSRIHIKRCYFSGQYCFSGPANTDSAAANQTAARSIWVQVDDCTGAGLVAGFFKGCVDITGSSYNEAHVKVIAHNPYFAAELKSTMDSTNVSPNGIRRVYADVVADTVLDQTPQILLSYENPIQASVKDRWRGMALKADIKAALAVPRLAGAYYPAGNTYSVNISGTNQTYIVVRGGITDLGGGPTGTSTFTGYEDGTAIVAYIQPTPGFILNDSDVAIPDFTNASAVQLEGLTQVDIDLNVQGLAYGLRFWPTGGYDNTITDVTARIRGVVSRSCIFDGPGPRYFPGQAVDHVSIYASDCRSAGNYPAIRIGGTPVNPIPWTNSSITASRFQASGGSSAFGLYNTGGSLDLDITSTDIKSDASPMYIEGLANIRVSGGKLECAGGVTRCFSVIRGVAGSDGTIELNDVAVRNSNPSYGTVLLSAGTLTVKGRAINEAWATVPTRACTAGLDYAPGTVPATAFEWGCGATNTWNAISLLIGGVSGGSNIVSISSAGAYQLPAGGGNKTYSNDSCGLVTLDLTAMDFEIPYTIRNANCFGSKLALDPGSSGFLLGLSNGVTMPIDSYNVISLSRNSTNQFYIGEGAATVARLGHYTYANRPIAAFSGMRTFCDDCRKTGEGGGAGTGTPITFDGTNWRSEWNAGAISAN